MLQSTPDRFAQRSSIPAQGSNCRLTRRPTRTNSS
jgi:hypothetical protein